MSRTDAFRLRCFKPPLAPNPQQDICADELSKRLPREVMLDHRAQLFEAINLEKALISRRRGAMVYKHISIIDLKVSACGVRGSKGVVIHVRRLTRCGATRASRWGTSATACAPSSPRS